MKSFDRLAKGRSPVVLLAILALPLSILIGAFRDFHWGYLAFCAQFVLMFVWRTLHDGEPKSRLYFGLIIVTIMNVLGLAMIGERLRAFPSYTIGGFFIADFVVCTWIIGILLRFDGEEQSHN